MNSKKEIFKELNNEKIKLVLNNEYIVVEQTTYGDILTLTKKGVEINSKLADIISEISEEELQYCKGDYYNFVDQYDRSGLYTYFSGYFQLVSHYALLGLVRQGAKALCIHDLDNGQAYVFDSSISSSSINPDNLNGLLPVALSHPLATSGNSVYCLLEPFIASLIDQGLSILRVDFE